MNWKKFPFYKQLDTMDCGATCLRMVARFYGRFYSLEYLRQITHLDREGVSLLGISDAAESLGMRTLAVKVNYEQLLEEVPLPCIAHWNQEHFVVVYEVGKRYVRVADPAHGRHKLSKEVFLKHWASDVEENEPYGILLLLEPTPDFYATEDEKVDKNGFAYLLSYIRRYRKLLIQLAIGLLVGSLIQVILPFLMQAIVDDGIIDSDFNLIVLILIAQGVLFLSQMSVEFLRSWILLHVGARVNINLVSDFLIKLMKLPVRFFDTKMTGDLLQRIYDNDRVERLLTSGSLLTLFSMLNFLIFGVILWYYNTTIFMIFGGSALLYFGWVFLFLRWRKDVDYKRFIQSSQNQSTLIEIINGMQELKLHNAEKQKRWNWERIQARLFKVEISYLRLEQFQRIGASFINESKNILITFIAAQAVINQQMTLGAMLAIQYIIGQLNTPLAQFVQFILMTQDAKISLERMNEIHSREDEENVDNKITIMPQMGDLKLKNVHFQYSGPQSPMILKNITLNIPKGKTTAIVGTSGSGKTTILKLLLGFYEPIEGMVTVGDTSLYSLSNRMWRANVGVVMQDGYIFTDTIANNIALGDEVVDKRKLLHSAKVANINSHIESLPLGYNTKVGRDGVGLSQGQKQRLLIARAVYKNPNYIFFDEATNALDAYNEMVVMDNLEEFFAGRTVVVVAHRLSTVKNADNIVVLEKGEIIEQGTHDELTLLRGAYYHLVKNQLELGA